VTPGDRLALLQDLYRDKAALRRRHEAGAARVAAYDANNAYQFAIEREAVHLDWLRRAITAMGASPVEPGEAPSLPAVAGADAARAVAEEDAKAAAAFVDRWRARVEAFSQARDRKMLELMLGEVQEHQRFFSLAASGSADLLGRRPEGSGTGGGVLPARWVG